MNVRIKNMVSRFDVRSLWLPCAIRPALRVYVPDGIYDAQIIFGATKKPQSFLTAARYSIRIESDYDS